MACNELISLDQCASSVITAVLLGVSQARQGSVQAVVAQCVTSLLHH